ncbi:MAG: histidine phosphatase family protein [Clostridiales bacterium]|nr:histidine phosphatase family protein [Clostridiales bacterium]
MKVDWLRHGQTKGNLEQRYVGTTDEPLTLSGREQAAGLKLEQPEMVFISPRIRCRETAELVYPGCPLTVISELAECSFGEFEYKNYRELNGDPRYQQWIDSGGTLGFPGGESREAFSHRCLRGFQKAVFIAESRQVSHISFVVHGGTIMAVLEKMGNPKGEYFSWQCKNLDGFQTRWDGKNLNILKKMNTV